MQVVRYKPEGLDALCKNTKFSRKELQIMYRGFKQVGTQNTFRKHLCSFECLRGRILNFILTSKFHMQNKYVNISSNISVFWSMLRYMVVVTVCALDDKTDLFTVIRSPDCCNLNVSNLICNNPLEADLVLREESFIPYDAISLKQNRRLKELTRDSERQYANINNYSCIHIYALQYWHLIGQLIVFFSIGCIFFFFSVLHRTFLASHVQLSRRRMEHTGSGHFNVYSALRRFSKGHTV